MALEITRMLHFPRVFAESDTITRKVSNVQLRSRAADPGQNLKSFHDTEKFPMCHLATELCLPSDSVEKFP